MEMSDFKILENFGRAVERATCNGYTLVVPEAYILEHLQNDLDQIDVILSEFRKQTEHLVFEDRGSTALFLFKTNLILFRLNEFAYLQRERIRTNQKESEARHLLPRVEALSKLSSRAILPQLPILLKLRANPLIY